MESTMLHGQCSDTVTSDKASFRLNKKPKTGLNRLPLVKPELAYARWPWNRMNSCLVLHNLYLVNYISQPGVYSTDFPESSGT